MTIPIVNNFLILGASSNIASEYISLFGGNNENKFYGLSTRPELSDPKFDQSIIFLIPLYLIFHLK